MQPLYHQSNHTYPPALANEEEQVDLTRPLPICAHGRNNSLCHSQHRVRRHHLTDLTYIHPSPPQMTNRHQLIPYIPSRPHDHYTQSSMYKCSLTNHYINKSFQTMESPDLQPESRNHKRDRSSVRGGSPLALPPSSYLGTYATLPLARVASCKGGRARLRRMQPYPALHG